MSETLTFERTHLYNTLKTGISLTAVLSHGDDALECEAKLDTGSSHCIFKRSHGELLGIDIESSSPISVATVTGSFAVHAHTIVIEVLGIRTESVVYFAADEILAFRSGQDRMARSRTAWVDRLRR